MAPEHDNTQIVGNVLKQLVETRLNFVHQKFILTFLSFEIKQIREELNLSNGDNNSANISTDQFLGIKDYEREYRAVMDLNKQNYRNKAVL